MDYLTNELPPLTMYMKKKKIYKKMKNLNNIKQKILVIQAAVLLHIIDVCLTKGFNPIIQIDKFIYPVYEGS